MSATLTAEQAARFHRDGFLFPVPAIAPDEAARHLAELEAIEARKGGRLPPLFNAKPHLLLPSLWALVHDPRILDPVAALLGPDILCLGTSFISKQPGDDAHVSWHQDATHWGLSSPQAVTAWVALTPSTPASGCVRMVPGTHGRQLDHDHPPDEANMLGRKERVLRPVGKDEGIDLILAPGEMSLHHPLVIHGSEPNTSTLRRTGFVIRYIPGDVRPARGGRASVTVARGRAPDWFVPEQAPEAPFARAALQRHAAILRALREVIYDGAGVDG